jgi:protein-L-isoaspartate(D-aspartate) O-methyltransferase
MSWHNLVENLIANGTLKTPEVVRAFSKLDRARFLPPEKTAEANEDRPIFIGYGQTISQPSTVAFMMELLKIRPGQKILDIGFGSGWTTALLAELAGDRGQIYATEIVPQLKEFGQKNVLKAGFHNVKFSTSNGSIGLESEAPFDRILCSASAPTIPQPLKKQLAEEGGRLVIPVGEITSSVFLVRRLMKETFVKKEYPGFLFVPLIGKHGVNHP